MPARRLAAERQHPRRGGVSIGRADVARSSSGPRARGARRRAEGRQVAGVAVVALRRLEDHRKRSQARVIEEEAERAQADAPGADVLVAVELRAQPRLGVVQVEGASRPSRPRGRTCASAAAKPRGVRMSYPAANRWQVSTQSARRSGRRARARIAPSSSAREPRACPRRPCSRGRPGRAIPRSGASPRPARRRAWSVPPRRRRRGGSPGAGRRRAGRGARPARGRP